MGGCFLMLRFKNNLRDKEIEKYAPYILFLAICFTIISSEIKYKVGFYNIDVYFHFSRFYDAAQQIKDGNFSLFQMNYSFDQIGRFINVVYGPVFAYLMGFILLITGTWFKFQLFTAFLIAFFTVCGMYLCLNHYWPENRLANTIIACIYLSSYHSWNNGTMFMTISLMLFPAVLYVGLRMVYNNSQPINCLQLGTIMAIVCQIHILSVILFSIALTIFFFLGLNLTSKKRNMIFELIKAITIFLLLTANIWAPILYFHSIDQMYNPTPFDLAKFAFGITHVMVILIPQMIYVATHLKESKINNVITISSAVLVFISSKFFPWNAIQAKFPILKETFQMPWRFSIIIYGLLLAGLAISCNNITKNKKELNKLFIPLFLLLLFLSNYGTFMIEIGMSTNDARGTSTSLVQEYGKRSDKLKATLNLMPHYYYPEYLPKNKDISLVKREKEYSERIDERNYLFKRKVLPNGKLQLSWDSPTEREESLPVVLYKDSQLLINGKKQKVTKSGVGIPTIKVKKGKNTAVLSYNTPVILLVAFYTSIFSWGCLIVYEIRQTVYNRAKLLKLK